MNELSPPISPLWDSVDQDSPLICAIKNLTPQAQRAVHLRYWEFNTIEEIAEAMGLTWDQADQLIEKAIVELRMELTQMGNNTDSLEAC